MRSAIDTLETDLISRVNRYCGDDQVGRRSLRALAQKAGVSRSWLSDFRNGRARNPTSESLRRIHTALLEFGVH